VVSFFYTESTSSKISYHFTVKYLYAGYNDVELIKQALSLATTMSSSSNKPSGEMC
jgi:hypothetical protein